MQAHCPACAGPFQFGLVHNGFNQSSYAYCGRCGAIALCSHWTWPAGILEGEHGPLVPEQIAHLKPCACGGAFHTHAMPRCPSCGIALDPVEAAVWIEAEAEGTAKGWRWQRSWQGLYSLTVGQNLVKDPWMEATVGSR